MERGTLRSSGALAAPSWDLPRHPTAPRSARQALAGELADLPEDLAEVAAVLTSELVTNAVNHGQGTITLSVLRDGRRLTVRVVDEGAALPVVRGHDPAALNGRGMQLVSSLALAWGTAPIAGGRGKAVWFTLEA